MLLAGCTRAPAPPSRLPHVGLLAPGSEQAYAGRVQAVEQGLRERGFVPNQTIALTYRYADGGREELLASLSEELLKVPVDVIVAVGSASIRPARDAARAMGADTPIVMVSDAADPVSAGYVESLAHPGWQCYRPLWLVAPGHGEAPGAAPRCDPTPATSGCHA